MKTARHIAVSIDRPASEVYAFASLPENIPAWAGSFVKSVRQKGDDWFLETDEGSLGIRFAATNDFGVLDHMVTLPNGDEVYVPMRVVPNGSGSEVVFTLLRTPDMTDERFERDARMVEADLRSLKEVLEAGAT